MKNLSEYPHGVKEDMVKDTNLDFKEMSVPIRTHQISKTIGDLIMFMILILSDEIPLLK